MHRYYLLDHHYAVDDENLTGSMGHLLAFNPGSAAVELQVTLFFEDQEPAPFALTAPPKSRLNSTYDQWPVEPDMRFAMMVECERPVVCQATVGWNNTKNDYRPGATTKIEPEVRECAKSYMALDRLATDWYVADGVVIDNPAGIWVRESEWAVLLNPGAQPATVTIHMHYGDAAGEHTLVVPARRMRCVYMDDVADRNRGYGIHFASDQPVAAQWLRAVYWAHRPVLMAFWSVPGVPGPLS
jgi:hypothetical protein